MKDLPGNGAPGAESNPLNSVEVKLLRSSYSELEWRISKEGHEAWQKSVALVPAEKRSIKFKKVDLDQEWIEKNNGVAWVDCSSVEDFDDLPWDIQLDGLRSARISIGKLKELLYSGPLDRTQYIEDAAAEVQSAFRQSRKIRNIPLPPHQDMDYEDMDEQTKDFDRAFPRLTLGVYDKQPHLFDSIP